MKRLAILKVSVLATLCILVFGASEANAQKRRPVRSRAAAATRTSTAANAAAVKQGAQDVSFQIKNLSKFIYLFGGSVQSLKTVEAEAKQGKLPANLRQQSETGRKGLIAAVTIQKNTMLDLEDKFRANAALKPYLLKLTGVGELATTAEEQAAAGNFEQAGRTLLEVLGQLTDTLQAMP